MQTSSLIMPLRWGHGSKPGPETGGSQRPDWQLSEAWPAPATPPVRTHGVPAKSCLTAEGKPETQETTM